jgi:hypothetical protein
MKIIHSFWSKPALSKEGNLEKFHGGWRHPKYHLMSWALSCLSFKKYYGEIELFTDTAGKHLLINQLQLPYTKVRVVLDELNDYPEYLWAIGKLRTYALQEEPFLHVDGDAFIWEKLNPEIENAEVVGHHLDVGENANNYRKAMNHLNALNITLPEYLSQHYTNENDLSVSSAGIIGGSNVDFFKYYSNEAFDLIDKNLSVNSETLMGDLYALVYEQYLFSVLAGLKEIPITHVFNKKIISNLDMADLMNKYGKVKYVHIFSRTKSLLETCHRLEHMLLLEFSDYHSKIKKLHS